MATVQTPISAATPDAPAASPNVLDQLSAWNVLIPDRADVLRYLAKYPGTGDVLPAMSAEARRAFGPSVELSLEVYHDRETVDEYLALYVRKDRYEPGFIDEVCANNRKFDDVLENATGFLQLTSDYRRPRGQHAV